MPRNLLFLVVITVLWCSPAWAQNQNSADFGNVVHLRDSSTQAVNHGAPKVEVYMTSWCPWCKKTLAFFHSRGIPVKAYDVERDSEAAKRKAQLDPSSGVPTTIIDGRVIQGYAPEAFERALKHPN
jgi:glutaredoxin